MNDSFKVLFDLLNFEDQHGRAKMQIAISFGFDHLTLVMSRALSNSIAR
jgi:hypothetical protein